MHPSSGNFWFKTLFKIRQSKIALKQTLTRATLKVRLARLMFVATLGMDNFDCTKMSAHFKKFTACLWEGLIHEWKQAYAP